MCVCVCECVCVCVSACVCVCVCVCVRRGSNTHTALFNYMFIIDYKQRKYSGTGIEEVKEKGVWQSKPVYLMMT